MKKILQSQILRVVLSAYMCITLLFFPIVPNAFAQVVVDPSSGGTKVINVGGADVIQINAPNQNGLSHNKFTDYNVGQNGVIINNSNFKQYNPGSTSQINGQHIEFNLNLRASDPARVILNEITGNNRSNMNGMTEIYGNQADLIIANPNGITCNGCGFINVDKLSMIAGTPNVVGGEIRDYSIMPMGIVEVNGFDQRFAVNTVNSAVLVADMVKLAGDINMTGDLSVLTGNATYTPGAETVTSRDSANKPAVAIDAYALGAMQAGNIRIYASQTGLGINVENGYVASANGLQITADGNIKVKDLVANENIDIAAGSGTLSQVAEGTITGNKAVNISGNVALAGDMNVGEDVNIAGGDVALNNLAGNQNINLTGDNMSLSGTVFAEKDVNITAGAIDMTGDYVAATNINVSATGDIDSKAELQSADSVKLASSAGDVTVNSIKAGNAVDIEAKDTLLFESGVVEAYSINSTADKVTNKAELASTYHEVNAGTMENMGHVIISGGGEGVFNTDYMHNYSDFASSGDLTFNTDWDFINYDHSSILAAGDIAFTTGRNFINYRSEIYSGGDMSFEGVDGFVDGLSNADKAVSGHDESLVNYYNKYKNRYYDEGLIPEYSFEMPTYEGRPEGEYTDFSDAGRIVVTVPVEAVDEEGNPILTEGEPILDEEGNPVLDEEGNPILAEGEPVIEYEEVELSLADVAEALEDMTAYMAYGESVTIDGYKVTFGKKLITVDEETGEETISYVAGEDDDKFTITNSLGEELVYVVDLSAIEVTEPEPGESAPSEGENIVTEAEREEGRELNASGQDLIKDEGYDYVASSTRSNSLFNIGGRIESGRNLDINTAHLRNIALDASTREDGKLFDIGKGYNDGNRVEYDVVTNNYLTSQAAEILASGSINIKADEILNESSTISAVNINIETGSLINRRSDYEVTLYEVVQHISGGEYSANVTYSVNQRKQYIQSDTAAKILARDHLNISSEGKIVNDQADDIRGAYGPNGRAIDLDYTSNFKLPEGNGGLFRVTTDDSQYLVQGNYLVLDPRNYVGSDYFFQQLGMKNGDKLLGDPAYETKLIMDQIRALVRYDDSMSDSEQMKALYDNAVAASGELGLEVGVALTAEQISKLKGDIVWYAYEEVEGQRVLVPKLYTAGNASQPTSSTMAGNRVDIKAGQLNNSGNIRGDAVSVDVAKINNNKGNIAADSFLSVEADNLNFNNTNTGRYVSGGDAVLKSNGNMLIEGTNGLNVKGTLQLEAANNATVRGTFNANNAVINAGKDLLVTEGSTLNINGELATHSGGDTTIIASTINADSAFIEADGAVSVLEVYRTTSSSSSDYNKTKREETWTSSTSTSTTVVGSKFNIGNTLSIKSGGDMTLVAAQVNAKNASLDAGGNLSILEAYNSYSGSSSKTIKSRAGWNGENTETSSSYSASEVVGSKFNISGELVLKAGGNATLRGAQVKAASAFIDAGGSVDIVEAYNSYSNYNSKGSSSGNINKKGYILDGKIASSSSSSSSQMVAGTSLNISGDLSVKSGGNTTIRGSSIKATNAAIDAKGGLNIVEAYNTSQGSSSSSYAARYWYADCGNDDGCSGDYVSVNTDSSSSNNSSSVAGSSLNIANGLALKSGGDTTIRGSSISAANASIEGRNVNIVEAYNNASANYELSRYDNGSSNSSTVVGSKLNIGNTLIVKSTGDTTIRGSQVNAKDASIETGGSLSIVEAYNTQNSASADAYSIVTAVRCYGDGCGGDISYGYYGERNVTNSNSSTVAGSSLNIGNILKTSSGGDTLIRGSNINAGAASITAGGNLVIAEAYNTSNSNNEKSTLTNYSRQKYSLASATSNSDTTAQGSSINVRGDMLLDAGNDMTISASSVAANAAQIDVGRNLTITSVTNSASNLTTESASGYNNGGVRNDYSTSAAGSNVAIAGNLMLTTGGNATIKGSTINAGNALIDIEGSLAMLEDYNSNSGNSKEGKKTTEWNNRATVGSSLNVGGNLQLTTGGDLTMVASNINAGNALIEIGGNTALLEAYDTTYSKSVSKKKSLFRSSTKTTIKETSTSVGSGLNIAGNLSMKGDSNALFRGANITVGNSALLNFTGDVNVLATMDYDYSYSKTVKSSFGGLISETTTKINRDEMLKSANVTTNEGLTIVSGGNTNVTASNLTSGGDTDVYTGYILNEDGSLSESGTGGSFNVLSGFENDMDFEETIKKNYFTAVTGILSGDVDISFSGGKFQASMVVAEESRDMSEYTSTTAVGSSINTGGSLNVASAGNVNIEGSTLNALGDMNISAIKDINITAAANNAKAREEHELTQIKATATVGNAYADAALAALALVEAGKAVDEATDELARIQNLYEDGKATKQAVADATLNLTMASANLANATIAAAAAVAGTVGSSSTMGTGMYASAGLAYDSTTDYSESNDTLFKGSEITAGGNISFNAGGNMLQQASLVKSTGGNVAYNIAGDLRFEAVRNSSTFKSGSESESLSVGIGTNGMSFGGAMSRSSNESMDYSHVYASTSAEEGTISYNVGGSMMGVGYNASAKHIKGDIKGDLTLTSLQDTGTSSNSSSGIGFSLSRSGSNTSGATTTSTVGGGANMSASHGSGNYTQTQLSSIIGTESVDLKVGGKLSMTGSAIANIDENGNDNGNLRVSAKSFEWNDLVDENEMRQTGFSAGTSMSVTSIVNNLGNGVFSEYSHNNGSTTMGFTNMGQEGDGVTRATIGKGSFTVTDGTDVSGLNRDTDKTQEMNELTTGALNGSFTLDHRVLTSNGWSQKIVKQKEEYGEAVPNDNGNPVFEEVEIGIIADFKDAGNFVHNLIPTVGSDRIKDEFGLVPHPTNVDGQDLGELRKDGHGEYYVVVPDEYISIYGQQVTDQNGIYKVAKDVNGETRLYVDQNKVDNMGGFFADTGWFGTTANNSPSWLLPGMTGTSQIHDVLMQRKEDLKGSNLSLPELIDTGVGTWFRNGYYSFGTGYRVWQDDWSYKNQYKEQTGSNIKVK